MTPIEYVLDHRFECIGAAISNGRGLTGWAEPDQLKTILAKLPARVAIVSHNALFDMVVLANAFNYVPTLMIDTLGMARAWYNGKYKSYSLGRLAEELHLGAKGTTVTQVKGMRLADIKRADLYEAYKRYSGNDVDICAQIYHTIMGEGFPASELLIMDTVLRCAVEPKFQINENVLAEHLFEIQNQKQQLLNRLTMGDKDMLMSNEKFAGLLKQLGVQPPMKISVRTGAPTYAFAKTDPDFIALEDSEDPDVQALVAARMGIKSTQEETRTKRFQNIARLTWPGKEQRWMPVPLQYGAAHTHRLGGEWKINLQNLNRNGKLKSALIAPKGHVVVKADASQIEARGVGWFCGQDDLTEQFAGGEDVYASFAERVFGRPINKKDNPAERFIGKTTVLGCGYGVGWEKFMHTIRLKSKADTGTMIDMNEIEARRVISVYRETYFKIQLMWNQLNSMIRSMTALNCQQRLGPIVLEYERVRLPNGLFLRYHDLNFNDNEWTYRRGPMRHKLYGGKFLENIIQALARILTMDAAARVRLRLRKLAPGLDLALQAHDELVYVVPEDLAAAVEQVLCEEMVRGSGWSAGWPLAVESKICLNYGG